MQLSEFIKLNDYLCPCCKSNFMISKTTFVKSVKKMVTGRIHRCRCHKFSIETSTMDDVYQVTLKTANNSELIYKDGIILIAGKSLNLNKSRDDLIRFYLTCHSKMDKYAVLVE